MYEQRLGRPMVTFREAIAQGARGSLCTLVSAEDRIRDWLRETTSTIPGVGAVTETIDRIGDAASELVCPAEGGSGDLRPPSAGRTTGNCELVPYLFEWAWTQSNGTRSTQTLNALLGPIGDFQIETNSQGNADVFIECRGVPNSPLPPGSRRRLLGNITNRDTVDPQILSLTRRDGQPDDCPPQEPGEPEPPTVDDDITYDPPGGDPPVTIPVTFIIGGPLLQVNNNVTIPINVVGPTFDIDLNFNLSTGDINFNFGTGNDDQSCCCLPEETGEEDEEPDDERRLLGVVVTSTIIPESPGITQVFNDDGPNLLLKDTSVVMYKVKVGEIEAWLKPLQVQLTPAYIPVPEGQYAVNYSVLARPGVTVNVTPVYATISPEVRLM